MGLYRQKEVISLQGDKVLLCVSLDSDRDPHWNFYLKVWSDTYQEWQYLEKGWHPATSNDPQRLQRIFDRVTKEQVLEVQMELWGMVKPEPFVYSPKEYDDNGRRIK